MDEKKLKFYLALAYLALATSVVLVIIDYKLKSDTIKMLGGNPLGPRADHQASVWDGVRYSRDIVPVVPDSRFAPRVEEGADNHVPKGKVWTTQAPDELGDGTGDIELPEGDQSL